MGNCCNGACFQLPGWDGGAVRWFGSGPTTRTSISPPGGLLRYERGRLSGSSHERFRMRRLFFFLFVAVFAVEPLSFAASTTTTTHRTLHRHAKTHHAATHRTTTHRSTAHRTAAHSSRTTGAHLRTASYTTVRRHRRHRFYERFTASSFANTGLTAGDVTAGEDPVVAVDKNGIGESEAADAVGDLLHLPAAVHARVARARRPCPGWRIRRAAAGRTV